MGDDSTNDSEPQNSGQEIFLSENSTPSIRSYIKCIVGISVFLHRVLLIFIYNFDLEQTSYVLVLCSSCLIQRQTILQLY